MRISTGYEKLITSQTPPRYRKHVTTTKPSHSKVSWFGSLEQFDPEGQHLRTKPEVPPRRHNGTDNSYGYSLLT